MTTSCYDAFNRSVIIYSTYLSVLSVPLYAAIVGFDQNSTTIQEGSGSRNENVSLRLSAEHYQDLTVTVSKDGEHKDFLTIVYKCLLKLATDWMYI